ncbi:MAG: hypothetical protein HY918_04500 [Candidatus Doudnabacteria bacterium]|nr:hypothetical protein [Candidatus Doudnabacteria bacterium]
MSKKHQHNQNSSSPTGVHSLSHEAEYAIIKGDLIKVVVLNVIYLAALMFLYYTNLQSHYMDKWFSKILHF